MVVLLLGICSMGTGGLLDTYAYMHPKAQGCTSVSGRPQVPMLQLLCNTFAHISIVVFS